jgi:hypothetical protein
MVDVLKHLRSVRSPRLNVIALRHLGPFRELANGYWLPFAGALSYLDKPEAALAAARAPTPATDQRSIRLYDVHLHSKQSYYGFYEAIAKINRRLGFEWPSQPATRPSFEKPCLIVREIEAEDPGKREGMGITAFVAEVCLPSAYRDPIRERLLTAPKRDWRVVLGFPVADFEMPASRRIERETPFKGRIWVFETDAITVDVS